MLRHPLIFGFAGWCAALVLSLLLGAASTCRADEHDATYFDALRARGLFGLAENVCQRRLRSEKLSPDDEAEMSIELSRTYAAHARSIVQRADRAAYWQLAREVVRAVVVKQPQHPQRLLLVVQEVFVSCEQCEAARLQLELSPFDRDCRAEYEQLIPRSLHDLTEVEAAISEMPTAAARPAAASISATRLRGLLRAVQLQLGETLMRHGEQFERGSPDRSGAFLKADQKLRKLAAGPADERVTQQSLIAFARLQRLRSDFDKAHALLDAMERDGVATDFADGVVIERLELFLSDRQPTKAADAMRLYRRQSPAFGGRLACLSLRVWLDLARTANARKDDKLTAELAAEAERFQQSEASLADGYWGARAHQLLAQFRDDLYFGEQLASQLREARSRYGNRDFDGAVSVFETAYQTAMVTGPSAISFEIGYSLGNVLFEQGRYEDAVRQLGEVVTSHTEQSRVAEAHLLQVVSLGRQLQQQPSRERREVYAAGLTQHIARYPQSATRHDAAWMLASLQERLLQTLEGIALYETIPPEHARADDARAAVARCYSQLVSKQRKTSEPSAEIERTAIERLAPVAQKVLDLPEPLTVPQRELLTHLARIAVSSQQPFPELTEAVVRRLEAASTATSLRLILLTRAGQHLPARSLIDQVAAESPNDLIPLAIDLQTLTEHWNREARQPIAELRIQALNTGSLQPEPLSLKQQFVVDQALADAHELLNHREQVLAACRRLLKANPADVNLLRRLADLEGRGASAADWKSARDRWRKLESLEQAGSKEWFKARAGVIQTSIQLSDRAEAEKLLRATRSQSPDLGDAETRARFKALEDALRSASKK